MPGGAAGEQEDALDTTEAGLEVDQVVEVEEAGLLGVAAADGVGERAGLLEDLFLHKVVVAALFGERGAPGDLVEGLGEFIAVGVGDEDAGSGEAGDFAVFDDDDATGVGEQGGDVRGGEELVVADAEDQWAGDAGGDDGVGITGPHDGDGVGTG